jgi:hypothetical protein
MLIYRGRNVSFNMISVISEQQANDPLKIGLKPMPSELYASRINNMAEIRHACEACA